jgi:hypothetical protein
MTPAALRRTYRAARTLDPIRTAAQQDRYDRAEATLRAALTSGPLALPGYRVTLADWCTVHDGPISACAPRGTHARPVIVARSDITNAAQLALWRMMSATQED